MIDSYPIEAASKTAPQKSLRLAPNHRVYPRLRGRLAKNQVLTLGMILLLVVQAAVAILASKSSAFATLHALSVFGLGLCFAALGRKGLYATACVCAYIAGCEVIWRIGRADVLYEFGKYGTSVIFIVAMLRTGRTKFPALPALYFALLLPSTILLLSIGDFTKNAVSFNLSGPLALAIGAWFFSNCKFSKSQILRIFLILAISAAGVAAVTASSTYWAKSIEFGTFSNKLTSGGFGPNQVSATLGLGAFAAFMVLIIGESSLRTKICFIALTAGLAIQSALTFSRGGLYEAAGGIILGSVYLARSPKQRVKLLLSAAILVAAAYFVVLPRLNSFTGGAFSERFSSVQLTGRDRIAAIQFREWMRSPIFGIGAGQTIKFAGEVAHTEFVRLICEHGMFGIVALVLLLAWGAKNVMNAKTTIGKALAAGALGWSIAFMLNEGMRLVGPSFMYALSGATLIPSMSFRSARARFKHGPVVNRPLPQLPVTPVPLGGKSCTAPYGVQTIK